MDSYEELNIKQSCSEIDPFTQERYKQFYKMMPKGTKYVLDIGCNTGRGGKVLKDLNSDLVISGLDVVKDRLQRLPKDVYQDNVYGSSTEIPVDDYSYDVVVAGEFIEHLYPTDVDKTLAEIFRVLKIGGRVLLTTPNPEDIKLKLRGGSVLGGAHVSQHHHDALKMKLKMIGFSGVKIIGSGKVSRYLGTRFPLLAIYGSYMAIGNKF